jgi:diguanylate cyclase (GGDEF)-like protein
LLLVIPDLMNLTDQTARILTLLMRSVFTIMAGLLFVYAKRIASFKKLAFILTMYELAAVFIYFYVLSMYQQPDFTIQLLGMFIIVIAIFLIPNIWIYVFSLSAAVAAGFLVYSYFKLGVDGTGGLDVSHFIAAAVYLAVEIALCGIFSYSFNKYKRGEYIARTELQRIYDTDPLTKIGNRAKLESEASKWIAYCKRLSLELSLMLVDVDNLKQLNDEFGHLSGDSVLCEIAGIMNTQLRESDVCIRWGGDEFILLLPNANIEEAKKLAERIRASIQQHKFNNDTAVTCSFGIANMKEGLSLDQLIRNADHSMYLAKKQGKDNVMALGE